MSDDSEIRLDSLYLTMEDFLHDRNRLSPDQVDMSINNDRVIIDFYKPGFDMAFILLDKSLYNRINLIQRRFQSDLGLSTHCILLQDKSRIRNLVKDLRQALIMYAVVVDVSSDVDNSYDLYVLYPYIEVQKDMEFLDLYELVNVYYHQFVEQVENQLTVNPQKCPHEKHLKNDGFVPLNDELRHYFCLLYDGRMLSREELNKVKEYLMVRKKSLKNADPAMVNFNRPVEAMRTQKNKYVFYEPLPVTNNYIDSKMDGVSPPKIYDYSLIPDNDYSQASITKEPQFYQNNQYITNSDHKALPSTSSALPSTSSALPSSSSNLSPLVSPAILLQHQNKKSPQKLISPQKNHPFAPKKSRKNEYEKESSNTNELDKSDLKSQRIRFSIGTKKNLKDLIDFDKTKSHSTPSTSSSTIDQSFSLPKSNKSKIFEGMYSPIHYQLSPVSSPDSPRYKKANTLSSIHHKISGVSTLISGKYPRESSKRKADSPIKTASEKHARYSTDLMETYADANLRTNSSSDNKQKADHKQVEDTIIIDDECEEGEIIEINSIRVVNLFKLALELSMLNLPSNTVVHKILHHSCKHIQSNIPDDNLSNVVINYETCKNQGFIDIINDIHELCDSVSPNFSMFAELDYLWAVLFPSSTDNDHLLVLFYRYIKLLVPFKAFNEYEDTMNSLSRTILKISSYVYFDYDAPFTAYTSNSLTIMKKSQSGLNPLPKLFGIYINQVDQIHTISDFSRSNIKKKEMPEKHNLKNCDQVILSAKIRFHIYSMFEYFFETVNKININISVQQIKSVYECIRSLRYCLRKLEPAIVNSQIAKPISFDAQTKSNDFQKDLFDALRKEVHLVTKELAKFKPIIFTAKHYEFLNYILDCCLRIENTVASSKTGSAFSSSFDSSWNMAKSDILGRYHITDFMEEFLNHESTISTYYHPQSELGYLRPKLQEHWKLLVYRALRRRSSSSHNVAETSSADTSSMEDEPDGSRICSELRLLPVVWRTHTFAESITAAVQLYSNEWDKLARIDTKNNFNSFNNSRHNVLFWFEKNKLPMAKIIEELSKCHHNLDRLFIDLMQVK